MNDGPHAWWATIKLLHELGRSSHDVGLLVLRLGTGTAHDRRWNMRLAPRGVHSAKNKADCVASGGVCHLCSA